MQTILALNYGSSTLKFGVFEMATLRLLARDTVERRPAEPDLAGCLATAGMEIGQIAAVSHRVVHAGPQPGPALLTPELRAAIERSASFAPLHDAAALAGIAAADRLVGPGVPQFAAFDTSFHHDLPAEAATYALPADLAAKYGLRRYGFHGISLQHVVARFAELCGRAPRETNLVVLHLGSGCSATAIRGGRSADTSMGFTPLEGLVMGTRSGDIDAGILLYLLREVRMGVDDLDRVLNRESGLLGLSGSSADVRALLEAEAAGDVRARLALDVFAYRIRKYIGAYFAVLGRVDAVVFTGGIGEHQPEIRARIVDGLAPLGVELDAAQNAAAVAGDAAIGARGARVSAYSIATDEERVLASEAKRLMNAGSSLT